MQLRASREQLSVELADAIVALRHDVAHSVLEYNIFGIGRHKLMVVGGPSRKIIRKHAPLAAASQDVEEGVEDLAKAVDPRPSTSVGGRQMRLDI